MLIFRPHLVLTQDQQYAFTCSVDSKNEMEAPRSPEERMLMAARFLRPPVLEVRVLGLKGEAVQAAKDGWRFGGFINFGRTDLAGWKCALVMGLDVRVLPVMDLLDVVEAEEMFDGAQQGSSEAERRFHKPEDEGSNPSPAPIDLPEAARRVVDAEAILGDLSSGFWVSVLDRESAEFKEDARMGQRVLSYWRKFSGSKDEGGR